MISESRYKTHGLREPVERVDTAGAVVFLAGAHVYKVKRAVEFPFMDLSTLDRRREACEAEIEVNRASAPQLYLSALPIARRGQTLALGHDGKIIEWAVHMRRFDESATLDRVVDRGSVSGAVMDMLALATRHVHARAPVRQSSPATRLLETYIEQSHAIFTQWPDLFNPPTARKLTHDLQLAIRNCAPNSTQAWRGWLRSPLSRRSTLAQHSSHRRRADSVRRRRVFGRDRDWRRSLYDLAFLLMDLEERGLRAAANRLFNRYLAPEPQTR